MAKHFLLFRLVPTMRCNYRCDYCFVPPGEKSTTATMFDIHPPQTWVDAMAKWKDYDVEFYCYGGEPFLLGGTYEVVKGWTQYPHVLGGSRLDTNTSFADKIVKRCASNKVKLNCSWHTRYDTLERFLQKARLLKQHDMLGMVNFVASRSNVETLQQQYHLTLDQLVQTFANKGIFLNVAADFNRLQNLADPGHAAYKEEMQRYTCPEDWRQLRCEKGPCLCKANEHFFTIQPNGDLTPCLSNKVCGNFFKGTLSLLPLEVCSYPCPCVITYPFRTDNNFPFISHLTAYVERNQAYRRTLKPTKIAADEVTSLSGQPVPEIQSPVASSPTTPNVSVVLPTYNHLRFLPAAIESLLAQTYTNFEVIIVNDGSTDGTRDYLDTLKDPRIRIIHQTNQRLPRALNAGFKSARGELLTWVSADNYSAPIFLEALVGALEAHPSAALAVSAFAWIDSDGHITGVHRNQDLSLPSLLSSNPGIAAFLYRRSCQQAVGEYEPELEGAEDWDMWMRLAERFATVYVPEILYYYRNHAQSMSSQIPERIRLASAKAIERALARRGHQVDLDQLYPALAECSDREKAEAEACLDFGTRMLRSPFAPPHLAATFLSAAFDKQPIPQVLTNLVFALVRASQWNEAALCLPSLQGFKQPQVQSLLPQLAEAVQRKDPNLAPTSVLFGLANNSELMQRTRARQLTYSLTQRGCLHRRSPDSEKALEHGPSEETFAAAAAETAALRKVDGATIPAPVVSVVIPCYKQAQFLPEAVACVVEQTLTDWEIIIVNDGSPDNTLEVAAQLQARYPNHAIHIVNQPNGGLANARNAGVRAAKGRYIYPLDADDKFTPDCLEKSVHRLEAHPELAIAYSDVQEFGELHRLIPSIDYSLAKLCRFNYITASALYRREAWVAVGGYNENMREGYEDWDFWLGCGERGFAGIRISEPLFLYRKKAGSMVCGSQRDDHTLKARMISNHPELFSSRQQEWAGAVLRGEITPPPGSLGPFIPSDNELAPLAISSGAASPKAGPGPMHLLFTMYGWAEEGGGTILPRQIAKALVRRGHRVSVIYTAAKPAPGRPAYHVESHQEDGVQLHGIFNRPAMFYDLEHPEREVNDPRMSEVVSRLVDRLQPDLVHYHSLLNFSLGSVEAIGARGIPAVYTSHNYWPLCPRMYLFKRDLTLCGGPSADGSRCTACIGTSARQSDYALRATRSREVFSRHIFRHLAVSNRVRDLFVGNGYDPERIAVLRQQPESVDWLWREAGAKRAMADRPQGTPLRVGFIGSLLPQKGVHVLLEAARKLPPGRAQVHLFGSGPDAYVKHLQSLDTTHAVQFHGGYELSQLPRLLGRIDVVVVPSVWEDCAPLVVAEALAARCVVVGSRIGGIPDFIDEERTGLLVPPRDVEALAGALRRFVEKPDLLRQMQAQIQAPTGFEAYLDSLERHYREALNQRAAKGASTKHGQVSGQPLQVAWEGSFLDYGSLSYVNRELTYQLVRHPQLSVTRVSSNIPPNIDQPLQALAREVQTKSPANAQIVVRHAWPPDWHRPKHGLLLVIQPWEFGSLPIDWVRNSRQVDEFWVPSNYVRQVYIESGVDGAKVQVVPNGVDPERFHAGASPMAMPTTKRFKFLFVGGTIHRKGPDVLLKAYLRSFTAKDDVCLVIKDFGGRSAYAGQTMGARIKALQAEPDAPEVLYLDEELPPETLPGLYTACDCLVHPYRGEGFGLPILEAMACGLPVIVTAGGAADDFAGEEVAYRIPANRKPFGDSVSGSKLAGVGWLLEPDCEALGAQLKWLVTNPEEAKAKGRLACEHARQHWTWEHAAQIAAARLRQLASRSTSEPATRNPQPATRPSIPAPLPACALLGQLGKARERLACKELSEAWQETIEAIRVRPFHPEAFLLLAEIAQTAGDSASARLCAEQARCLAPGWKPARQFLNRRLNGKTHRPDWLALPDGILPHSLVSVKSHENGTRTKHHEPRLTVCLIARNEEEFLPQCLKSIKDIAWQIVLVDTGSTDRTVEIARSFGAEVHHFQWCDDFSAARNAALEQARGDWILVLDADEELASNQQAQIRADMLKSKAMALRLPMIDAGHDQRVYVPRLFRNVPGACFQGRIHEQVFKSLLSLTRNWGLEGGLGTALLVHHGYTEEVMKDRNKIQRNLSLLRQAVLESPDDPNIAMNLGLELVRSGDFDAGLNSYRAAFRLMSAQTPAEVAPELREALLTQFSTYLRKAQAPDEIIATLTSPLAKQGGLTASLHFALGLAYFELKQSREAAEQIRSCLAKSGQSTFSPANDDIATAVPYHCLGISLARQGDLAGAEKAFQAGLARTGGVEALSLDYVRLLHEQKRSAEALQRLHEVVTANAQLIAAWHLGGQIALSGPDFLEVARDWTAEAIARFPEDATVIAQRAEALMLSRDTTAARWLWQSAWENSHELPSLAALILCELAEGAPPQPPRNAWETAPASREFIGWYRKCLAAGARDVILAVNTRVDELRGILPEAANLLEAALADVGQPKATEPCVA